MEGERRHSPESGVRAEGNCVDKITVRLQQVETLATVNMPQGKRLIAPHRDQPLAVSAEEWLLLHRSQLHQQVLTALPTLVQSYKQEGNDEQVHHYASRQLALDPSREEAHRQLMRSLARRGLRTEALAQYESCGRLLREQLGVEKISVGVSGASG